MTVLKVAAGVFLGIMAVLVALAIPKWLEQSRAAHAEETMALLTPEQVIVRCGNPAYDKTDDWMTDSAATRVRFRSLSYGAVLENGVAGQATIVLEFKQIDGVPRWSLVRFSTDYTTRQVDDPVQQVNLLPCLSKR